MRRFADTVYGLAPDGAEIATQVLMSAADKKFRGKQAKRTTARTWHHWRKCASRLRGRPRRLDLTQLVTAAAVLAVSGSVPPNAWLSTSAPAGRPDKAIGGLPGLNRGA